MYCEHFIQKNFLNQLKTDRNHLNLESFYPISIFDELSWLLIYHGWIVPVLSASFHSTNCPPPPPGTDYLSIESKTVSKVYNFYRKQCTRFAQWQKNGCKFSQKWQTCDYSLCLCQSYVKFRPHDVIMSQNLKDSIHITNTNFAHKKCKPIILRNNEIVKS